MNPHASLSVRQALCACLVLACVAPVRALYQGEPVRAFRVADNAFTIDGKPDSLWRTIFAADAGNQSFAFQDYSKMVILAPEKVRNDDPSKYVKNPIAGSATLMAAYDSKALYFYFLIKTTAIANPRSLGCAAADLWKVDAAEVYVDPAPWSADPSVYHSYFTADASGLIYGTSPRSIQVDKPISQRDSSVFFRNRATADRFQSPATRPAGIRVAAAHSPTDTAWVGVEMQIPFWTAAADFASGKRIFISWGFNLYSDSARTTCAANPLAYRWAKNVLNYGPADEKPPGWKAGDSTHYDPTHSWDGWGALYLKPDPTANQCHYSTDPKAVFEANWDPAYWRTACRNSITVRVRALLRQDAAGMPVSLRLPGRDLRGRRVPPSPLSPVFPAAVPSRFPD